MDTCLGIDNDGNKISYRAFSDYWTPNAISEGSSITLTNTIVRYDFSPKNMPTDNTDQFDVPSSYLFSIAKYAPIIYEKYSGDQSRKDDMRLNSPNSIWASWRRSTGCLRNADYFLDTYFKDYHSRIPVPAFNYDYKQKYLRVPKSSTSFTTGYIADAAKFWGRKIAYTKYWLNKRLHILDSFFNMQQFNDIIGPN